MKHDVIIVGAGLAGLSLALALAAQRRSVLLLDAKPAPVIPAVTAAEFDQRIYAVSPAGAAWLRDVRVWQALDAARVTPVYDMRIHGDAELAAPVKGAGLIAGEGLLRSEGLHLSAHRILQHAQHRPLFDDAAQLAYAGAIG